MQMDRATRCGVVVLAALVVALSVPLEACADLAATAIVTTSSTSAPYDYTVTLQNTGTTDIGTFWFAWTDFPADYDFLPSAPTVTGMPAGWFSAITHNGTQGDGYGIEYYNISGSPIPRDSGGTFEFTSSDSPLTIEGGAFAPPNRVTTSFVYIGFAFTDPGFVFNLPVVSTLTGDANFDGIVNGLDISLIAGNWLKTGAGDTNGDGLVNGLDISVIASNWLHTHPSAGGGSGATSVPEPSTLSLAALAGLGLVAYRRRLGFSWATLRQARLQTKLV